MPDMELTWACQGSTCVITCFADIVTVYDSPIDLASCRLAPAMKPVHAQCLMAHRSKFGNLEVVQWLWSFNLSLSVCSLSANNRICLILVVLTQVGSNVPCPGQSGWPRWVRRVVFSRIYSGILFWSACLGSSLCAISFPFTREFVFQNGVLTCGHRLWTTPAMWYLYPDKSTSVGGSCTHGGVGFQCLGSQLTSIWQDLSRRWVFSSLALIVYSSDWDLLFFTVSLSRSPMLLVC